VATVRDLVPVLAGISDGNIYQEDVQGRQAPKMRHGRLTYCPQCHALCLYCGICDPPADGRCNRCLTSTSSGFYVEQEIQVPAYRGMMAGTPFGMN
jgi:hypothetical protein